ncbi:unnamed protein product, partial [Prorocentrum cordatum]
MDEWGIAALEAEATATAADLDRVLREWAEAADVAANDTIMDEWSLAAAAASGDCPNEPSASGAGNSELQGPCDLLQCTSGTAFRQFAKSVKNIDDAVTYAGMACHFLHDEDAYRAHVNCPDEVEEILARIMDPHGFKRLSSQSVDADSSGKTRHYMGAAKLTLSCGVFLVQRGQANALVERLVASARGNGFEPAVFLERHRGDETPFAKVRVQTRIGGTTMASAAPPEQLADQDADAEVPLCQKLEGAMVAYAVNTKVYQNELLCGALFTSTSGCKALLASFELLQPLSSLDRCKAECYVEMFRCLSNVLPSRSQFRRVQRLAITDGDGALDLAERVYRYRNRDELVGTLHLKCLVHRVYHCIKKPWVTGIIRWSLSLRGPNYFVDFVTILSNWLQDKLILQWIWTSPTSWPIFQQVTASLVTMIGSAVLAVQLAKQEMMAAYRALDETERRRLDEVGKAAAQAHRLDGPSFSVDKYARKRLRRQRGEVGAELRQLELALKQDISEKDAVDLKPSTSMALPSSGDWDSNLKAVITGVREDNKRDRQFEEIVGNELATYSAKESSTRDAADKFAYDDVGKVSGESASLPVPDLGVQGQCVFRHIEGKFDLVSKDALALAKVNRETHFGQGLYAVAQSTWGQLHKPILFQNAPAFSREEKRAGRHTLCHKANMCLCGFAGRATEVMFKQFNACIKALTRHDKHLRRSLHECNFVYSITGVEVTCPPEPE